MMSSVSPPCVARLVELRPDGTGTLETPEGLRIKCGVTAFTRRKQDTRWLPTLGGDYLVVEARHMPVIGLRATRIEELTVSAAVARPSGPMPVDSLATALTWLRAQGAHVETASAPASQDDVSRVEVAIGRTLPADTIRFLTTHHWFATSQVATLAACGHDRMTIAAGARTLRAFCETQDASEAIRARAAEVSSWIPLVAIGNPLPLGSALMLDDDDALRFVVLRELAFVPPGPPERRPLEELLVELLARHHRDDGGYDNEEL